MKRLVISVILALAALLAASAGEYEVYGQQGGLDIRIILPEGGNSYD